MTSKKQGIKYSNANYYVPVSDEAFEDIKTNAMKIWETYDNEFGYVDEKISRFKDIENVGDNGMYIIAMFDPININRLLDTLKPETIDELMDERIPDHVTTWTVNKILKQVK